MSVNPNLVRWDAKYGGNNDCELIEPKGEPELVEWLTANPTDTIQRPLALELACGKGGNALYLATTGYDVIASDGAVEGLKHCVFSARESALPVYPVAGDLEGGFFLTGQFHLISVVRYLHRELVPFLIDRLAPGGVVFFKTFNLRFLQIKPHFPSDYVLKKGELVTWFNGFEVLASNDDDETSVTSFIIAKKPT